jgi:hypothetical protein
MARTAMLAPVATAGPDSHLPSLASLFFMQVAVERVVDMAATVD